MLTCVCRHDKELIVDPTIFTYCTPVLARFFGEGDFAAPTTDERGRLTFLKTFAIERERFIPCITFLRSGHVDNIEELMDTFNIFGGCGALDALYLKQKKQQEVEETMQLMNPLTPKEDVFGKFQFRAAQSSWQHDGSWTATTRVADTVHDYWYRKNGVQNNNIDE